jgi:hypothetical protein
MECSFSVSFRSSNSKPSYEYYTIKKADKSREKYYTEMEAKKKERKKKFFFIAPDSIITRIRETVTEG